MDLARLKIDRGGASGTRRPARRRLPLGWILLLLVAVALAWVFQRPIRGLIDRARLPAVECVEVVLENPLARSAVSGTAANGYIVASRRAALSADTPGRIVEMRVTEGSVVREGEVVARLYAEEYEAVLRRAEAELAQAERTLERARTQVSASEKALDARRASIGQERARQEEAQADRDLAEVECERAKSLLEQGVESEQNHDRASTELERQEARLRAAAAALQTAVATAEQASGELEVARASLAEAEASVPVLEAARDLAQATLDKTEVRAPFDGVVVLKDAEVGEVVSPNSQGGSARGSVVTMVDFASLEVQVDLPERSLAAVRIEAPVNIYLDAWPTRPYLGQVQRIWPTADRQTATVEVRIGFEEPDELLRPEMGVRVVFDPGEAPGAEEGGGDGGEPRILLPAACVVQVEGRSGAFLLERGRAVFRPVEIGPRRSGRVVVLSGMEEGELAILDPPADLADGDRVRVREAE